MNESQENFANDVLDMLQRQKFADWYNEGGKFDCWICGDTYLNNPVTREEILNDICNIACR